MHAAVSRSECTPNLMMENDDHHPPNNYNILELYSGIGGFHFAIKELLKSTPFQLIAWDINTSSNRVYRLNHHQNKNVQLFQRNIQSLTSEYVDQLKLFLLTMSPPCQPFTRLGNQKDLLDPRCESFLHLMDLLKKLSNKPRFIMLENVKGFETSEAHRLLIDTLNVCKYDFEEYLLSPEQFSVPNSRRRYYLLAKHSPNNNSDLTKSSKILTAVPQASKQFSEPKTLVENYLEELNDEERKQFSIKDDHLLRYHMILDLVEPSSNTTNCFTKSYGQRFEGCGSILKTSEQYSIESIYKQINEQTMDDSAKLELLRKLELRFFTPREVANLMCFPKELKFPKEFTVKQCYRLLGNSVNVKVCHHLLKHLIGHCS